MVKPRYRLKRDTAFGPQGFVDRFPAGTIALGEPDPMKCSPVIRDAIRNGTYVAVLLDGQLRYLPAEDVERID